MAFSDPMSTLIPRFWLNDHEKYLIYLPPKSEQVVCDIPSMYGDEQRPLSTINPALLVVKSLTIAEIGVITTGSPTCVPVLLARNDTVGAAELVADVLLASNIKLSVTLPVVGAVSIFSSKPSTLDPLVTSV
jgi:hypothetical protein